MAYYSLDTETYLISGRLTPRLMCGQIADESGETTLMDSADTVKKVASTLHEGSSLVFQNAAYDLGVLMVEAESLIEPIFTALSEGRIYDTMIREILINNATGQSGKVSLSAMVERRYGVSIGGKDTTRLLFSSVDGVPIDEWPAHFKEYATDDAAWTMRVYQHQAADKTITSAGQPVIPLLDEQAQVRASVALHLAAIWGMAVDPLRVVEFTQRVSEEARAGVLKASQLGFMRPTGTKNMKVLKDLVSRAYEGKPPTTASGAVSTAREVLEDSGDADLIEYAESLTAAKLLSTYVPILQQASVHPRYQPLVGTGRTACRAPNMQNPPRQPGFRQCFRPRPGYKYVSADYSQIELLALAQINLWLFGSSKMAETIKQGKDLHCKFVADMQGKPYEEVYQAYRDGDPATVKARQTAKGVLYGLPGGLGSAALVKYLKGSGVVITESEADQLRVQYLRSWPEMDLYYKRAAELTKYGDATIIHHISGRQRAGLTWCQVLNTPFQGLTADGAKLALWLVCRETMVGSGILKDSRVCLFLHDEIMLEVPEADAEEAGAELSRLMIKGMQQFIPDLPIKAEAQITDEWSK